MANTISKHYRESQKPSVPEDSVPLVGLPLEDAEAESGSINDDEERKNDQSQAPIKASPGSKTLSSIFQAKDAHETTSSSIYTPQILDEDRPSHSTDEEAVIGLVGAEIPPTPSDIPPQRKEPPLLAKIFIYPVVFIIFIFGGIFVLVFFCVTAVKVGALAGRFAMYLLP